MPHERPSGRTTAQIAGHNSRALLEALRRSGPLTRTELAARLGLTIPGITNVTRRLLDDALIIETKRKLPSAPVPTAQYALDPDGAFAVGLRPHRGWVRAVLIDLTGAIRARAVARDQDSVVKKLIAEVGFIPNIVGIGAASDTPMPGDLPALIPPVAAVLAEWSRGPSAASHGLAVILIEERIRAGLFFHGRPFAGVNQRAGRIGEMRTGEDRRPLDEVASTAAYRRASVSDASQRRWIDEAARHLLDALLALAGFLGPAQVTIAGDLPADVGSELIHKMIALSAAREREATVLDLPEINQAQYGADAVLAGAALLPFLGRLLPDPR